MSKADTRRITMKVVLSFVLILVLVATMMPGSGVGAFAQEDATVISGESDPSGIEEPDLSGSEEGLDEGDVDEDEPGNESEDNDGDENPAAAWTAPHQSIEGA